MSDPRQMFGARNAKEAGSTAHWIVAELIGRYFAEGQLYEDAQYLEIPADDVGRLKDALFALQACHRQKGKR